MLLHCKSHLRALAAIIAAGLLTVGFTASADTGARKATYQLDIPSQNLNDALQALALASSHKLFYQADLVAGKSNPPLKGEYTTEQAIRALLANTSLGYEISADGVVFVREKDKNSVSQSDASPSIGRLSPEAQMRLSQSGQSASPSSSAGATQERPVAEQKQPSIEEIVVTAQKRAQRLQDVPISISVLRGEELDRYAVQGTSDALRRVPGVALQETYQGGGTQLVMRGVTAGGALFNGSSPVSYYVDSVPFGMVRNAVVPDPNAYDLERIEVLRGPQGTLYGSNAQNGVIRVLTKDANPDRFEFKTRVLASSTKDGDNNYRGDMAVNFPIVEGKLAARLSAGYHDAGGWIDRPNKKDANDATLRNARLKINAAPTDKLSIGASLWTSRSDARMAPISDDDGIRLALVDETILTQFDAYGLKVDYDFPAFSFNSSTGYLDYMNDGKITIPQVVSATDPGQTILDAQVLSQEFLLASTRDGAWRWTAGGMYRDAEDRQRQRPNQATIIPSDFSYFSKSFAVFGELTRVFLDGRFELTGGLRYFEDDVKHREDFRLGVPANTQLGRSDAKFDAVTPRVVLTWHPNDTTMAYASYAEGFRSGFPQSGPLLATAPQFPPIEPDTLTNYELGMKKGFWGGRASFDAAVYYIDWQDVQQSLNVLNPNVTIISFLTALINAPSASGIGVDVDFSIEPIERLTLTTSFSWNDLTVDEDVISSGVVLFAKGDRLNVSPEYVAGASAEYAFPMGAGGLTGRMSLSSNYTSGMDLRTIASGSRRIVFGDGISNTRASFSIESAQHWATTLFADNITNEKGSPIRFPFLAITGFDSRVRPLTIGVQAEYHFE